MRKNSFIIIFNLILLLALPSILLTVNINKEELSKKIVPKKLATSFIKTVNNIEEPKEKSEEIIKEEKDEQPEVIEENTTEIYNDNITNNVEETAIPMVEQKNDILRTYTGKMSFYSANCVGCNGLTSTGTDISDGRLYYYDDTYGNLRIIAAETEIKKWSVVRLKNTSLGTEVLAIVLDRGGSIGEGKTYLIDI